MIRTNARSGSPYEQRYGFSRAVRIGDRVIVAGTAPIAEPGEALGATAYDQMLRSGAIAIAALEELGAGPHHVVRTRMFIADADYADEVGRAHRELFGEAAPAATMAVAQLIDPSWKVELEVEAVIDQRHRGAKGLL